MLSERERELLVELWDRLTPAAEDIGAEALLRWASLSHTPRKAETLFLR